MFAGVLSRTGNGNPILSKRVYLTRMMNQDKDLKTEQLFGYLTGEQFKARFTTIVQAHRELREGLDKEKKMMMTSWSRRDKQLELLQAGTAAIYGDLSGIIGKTIAKVEDLELDESDKHETVSTRAQILSSEAALRAALRARAREALRPIEHKS